MLEKAGATNKHFGRGEISQDCLMETLLNCTLLEKQLMTKKCDEIMTVATLNIKKLIWKL